jgi:hypothetical protein
MDLMLVLMVREANSLNSYNAEVVKSLNNLDVVHIVINTSRTLIVGFTYCPIPSSHAK